MKLGDKFTLVADGEITYVGRNHVGISFSDEPLDEHDFDKEFFKTHATIKREPFKVGDFIVDTRRNDGNTRLVVKDEDAFGNINYVVIDDQGMFHNMPAKNFKKKGE